MLIRIVRYCVVELTAFRLKNLIEVFLRIYNLTAKTVANSGRKKCRREVENECVIANSLNTMEFQVPITSTLILDCLLNHRSEYLN